MTLAAVGWALMIGAGAGPVDNGRNYQAARDSIVAQHNSPPAPAGMKQDASPKQDTGCETGKDERQSDLCAQWKAADAARDAADSAHTQTLIGYIGLLLGAITMAAAIAAALYARRAAVATEETVAIARDSADGAAQALAIAGKNAAAAIEANNLARNAQRAARIDARREARRVRKREEISDRRTQAAYAIAEQNAKAATQQVELARDTASKQLRAYIGVLGAKAYFVGQPLSRIVIEIKNFGQTPAFGVTSHTGLYIDTHQRAFPGKRAGGTSAVLAHEYGIVEPGQERIIWIDLPDDWIGANIEALRTGDMRLFCETRIQYSDVGGVDRHRSFCCYLPHLRGPGHSRGDLGIPMTITASGNVDGGVGEWAETQQLGPFGDS